MLSIDVIIPSYRLLSEYLLPIVQMDIPEDAQVRFLIIADNPKAEIPSEIGPFIDNKKVILIRNPENLGVCKTRNIGIESSTADWLLFLDDDVKPSKNLLLSYASAIHNNPADVGFFGDVVFPSATNSFTAGIRASGMLGLFSVPKESTYRKWTPTANVIVKKSAIGDVRFNEVFAKNGAGEEIDFFLRIYKSTNKELRGIKNAEVYHNWWYNGKRIYSRFIRWNTGIALLPNIFPEYKYKTFPNIAETVVFGLPIVILWSILAHSFLPITSAIAGIIGGEIFGESLRLRFSMGLLQTRFAFEVIIIRGLNDMGRLITQIKTPEMLKGICERFDVMCDGKNLRQQRFWAGVKFISYLVITALFYYLLSR